MPYRGAFGNFKTTFRGVAIVGQHTLIFAQSTSQPKCHFLTRGKYEIESLYYKETYDSLHSHLQMGCPARSPIARLGPSVKRWTKYVKSEKLDWTAIALLWANDVESNGSKQVQNEVRGTLTLKALSSSQISHRYSNQCDPFCKPAHEVCHKVSKPS